MLSPVRLSSVCRLSVTLVLHTQPVEILGNFSTPFGTVDIHKNFAEIVPGALHRGVAKYSDFGPIEGCISETVQDRR